MIKLKIIFVLVLVSILTLPVLSHSKTDLNPSRMKSVTSDILDLFVSGKSDNLRKYISQEWLDDKEISLSKYKINNYSPTYYNIHYAGGDICVATIGGDEWMHLLIFKFTNEAGTYRVVPHGFAESNKEYIDPWWYVSSYITDEHNKDK
jgi:hypothetical protein